ncbi:jg607, partial [Pararge aegeria aegeria]
LNKTSSALKDEGYEVASYVIDLADRAAVYSTAQKVKIEVGKVDILINNAGIVFGETLLDLNDAAIETTYKVNIISHYWHPYGVSDNENALTFETCCQLNGDKTLYNCCDVMPRLFVRP